MSLRRRSREVALQILFQCEFGAKLGPNELLNHFCQDFEIEPEVREFAETLIQGIFAHREKINGAIQAQSVHWKVDRMALVDLNVMRIAVFEIMFLEPPTPVNAAINEAIEIAKKYGTTDSGAFVNGILDNLLKKS